MTFVNSLTKFLTKEKNIYSKIDKKIVKLMKIIKTSKL